MFSATRKSNPGFTLIEVVAALAIVGTVFVTLISFVVHQVRIAGLIRDYTVASFIADWEMNYLRLTSIFPDASKPTEYEEWMEKMENVYQVDVSTESTAYLPIELTENLQMPEVQVKWGKSFFCVSTYLTGKETTSASSLK